MQTLTISQEPKLWYGIGILYDRYGSLEHAEEAFSQVMQMQPDFEKANEIYFRLGIIYKQQAKYGQSLEVILAVSPIFDQLANPAASASTIL
jgi:lipoprotein NlpI